MTQVVTRRYGRRTSVKPLPGYAAAIERSVRCGPQPCLLHCYRFIELNPGRTGMVKHSLSDACYIHAHNAFARVDPLIDPHAAHLAPGSTDNERNSAYRALAMANLSQGQLVAIRTTFSANRPSP